MYDKLFERISIRYDDEYCIWKFKYNGENYMKVYTTHGATKDTQKKAIEEMAKTMKKLIK